MTFTYVRNYLKVIFFFCSLTRNNIIFHLCFYTLKILWFDSNNLEVGFGYTYFGIYNDIFNTMSISLKYPTAFFFPPLQSSKYPHVLFLKHFCAWRECIRQKSKKKICNTFVICPLLKNPAQTSDICPCFFCSQIEKFIDRVVIIVTYAYPLWKKML